MGAGCVAFAMPGDGNSSQAWELSSERCGVVMSSGGSVALLGGVCGSEVRLGGVCGAIVVLVSAWLAVPASPRPEIIAPRCNVEGS